MKKNKNTMSNNRFRYFTIFLFSFFIIVTTSYSFSLFDLMFKKPNVNKSTITKITYEKIEVNSLDDIYKKRDGLYVFSHINIDLRKLSPEKRKDAFVRLLLPSINVVQKQVLNNREIVSKLENKKDLTEEEKIYLKDLFKTYRTKEGNWKELKSKMIIYPTSLILSQGALESAWGTSRFFREGNNAFGIWSSSSKEKTIAAKNSRGTFTAHLRAYDTLKETVDDNTLLISRSGAYKNLRNMIWENKSPYDIAGGLIRYSEEGQKYVRKIRNTMKHNDFEKYDKEIPYCQARL